MEWNNGVVRAKSNTGDYNKIPALMMRGSVAYASIVPPYLEFPGYSHDQCITLHALHGYSGARKMSYIRPVFVRNR